MGEVIYDIRFIKLDENQYIPIIQHGNGNNYDIDYKTGQKIYEKLWNVFNIPHVERYVFTSDELIKMALKYKQLYDVKGNIITPKRFQEMYEEAIRKAEPIEYYAGCGNAFVVSDMTEYIYNDGEVKTWEPKTTKELLEIIEHNKGRHLKLGFKGEKIIEPAEEIKVDPEERKVQSFICSIISKYLLVDKE